MRQKKTLTFDTFFQACICGAAAPQVGRLLLKSAGFVHTQVSKTPCSFTYGSFGAVFVSSTTSFVTEMEVVMQTRQNASIFLTHTVQASLLNKDADQVSPTNIV